MSGLEHATGAWSPGTVGSAVHHGDPLTVDEIKALSPETRIVVTWSGGNGPWEGSVVHDKHLGVCYQTDRGGRLHPLLQFPEPWVGLDGKTYPAQTRPLNRVTLAKAIASIKGEGR